MEISFDDGKLLQLIIRGLKTGVVKLINSPNNDGAVCKIGEYWFYFGAEDIEKPNGGFYSAEEYLSRHSYEDLVLRIMGAIKDLYESGDEGLKNEAQYYICYLRENYEKTEKKNCKEKHFVVVKEMISDCSKSFEIIDVAHSNAEAKAIFEKQKKIEIEIAEQKGFEFADNNEFDWVAYDQNAYGLNRTHLLIMQPKTNFRK